jgi:hypothetical protein
MMHRLSSIGRELYDRVVHRSATRAEADPTEDTDGAPRREMSFDVSDEVAIADQLAVSRDIATSDEVADDIVEAAIDDADDEVEAATQAEIAEDLAALDGVQIAKGDNLTSLDVDQLSEVDTDDVDTSPFPTEVAEKDGGDLYGLRIAAASDREQMDDDESFETGQSWTESLHTHAAEGGPEPEHDVDIVDDRDVPTSSADSKDRPIADRGSGGRRGR